MNGKPTHALSERSIIWQDVDKNRTGMLPFVFEEGFGFERYVDYALDVPMYFVYRDGKYIDCTGQSFRDFLKGNLPGFPGEKPTRADWEDHLTTIFPEVRLKSFMEMRGADGGPWRRICALPAFWVGLLYDQTSLESAWDLVKNWSASERETLRHDAPRLGLQAQIHGQTVHDIARQCLKIAENGLKARAMQSDFENDESHFLNDLEHVVETGQTSAEVLLNHYHSDWEQSFRPLYRNYSY
jgi:glutamate--cysteine ligase